MILHPLVKGVKRRGFPTGYRAVHWPVRPDANLGWAAEQRSHRHDDGGNHDLAGNNASAQEERRVRSNLPLFA